jgi:hypothetical protein
MIRKILQLPPKLLRKFNKPRSLKRINKQCPQIPPPYPMMHYLPIVPIEEEDVVPILGEDVNEVITGPMSSPN